MNTEPKTKPEDEEENQDEVTIARSILDDIIEETENGHPSDSLVEESDGCLGLKQ